MSFSNIDSSRKISRSSDTHDVINLDISSKCTLACPFCERQSKEFNQKLFKDMSFDEFKFIADHYDVFFCGQISDPIYNKDLREMLEYLYKNNRNASIHTAAYRNNEDFYLDLFKVHPKALWVFGIDGLPNKSAQHRINQKSEDLFKIMIKAKYLGMNVIWQMIVFDFNEKDIPICEFTAKKLNIDLRLIYSNRFTDWKYKPSKEYYIEKTNLIGSELNPQCLQGRELGHSAMGYVMPCCWMAEGNVEKKYPNLCNDNTKIQNKNFSEINKAIFDFKKMLKNNPHQAPLKCWEKCSNKSTSHKRYIDV